MPSNKKFPTVLKKMKYMVEDFMVQRFGLLRNPDGTQQVPVIFEVCDWNGINELAAYGGFPRRYHHPRWGMEYDELAKGYGYGLQKIYEMVINNNPVIAYLLESNGNVDHMLVMAHVYAHADFFFNNIYFEHTHRKALDMMGNHAVRIDEISESDVQFDGKKSEDAVEAWLDVCISVEDLIDRNAPALRRHPLDDNQGMLKEPKKKEDDEWEGKFDSKKEYMREFINPPEEIEKHRKRIEQERKRRSIEEKGLIFPEEPVRDVLGFLVDYSPLENWQRETLEIIRAETYYFVPQAQTKILNEGWASFWHARAMTEGLADTSQIVDYADHNSGTLAVHGPGRLNPYALGKALYQDLVVRYDTHRYGPVYERCDYDLIISNWDQFVAFKNIQEETKGDERTSLEHWNEFLCFWKAVRDEKYIPKALYNPDLLLRWWGYYLEIDRFIEETNKELQEYLLKLRGVKRELKKTAGPKQTEDRLVTKKEFYERHIRWGKGIKKFFIGLTRIKKSFREGGLQPESFSLPQTFFTHAKEYPGRLSTGLGMKKIFEVRKLYCDLTALDDFLTPELAIRAKLFEFDYNEGADAYLIVSREFDKIKSALLRQMTNSGRPDIRVVDANWCNRNELYLKHYYDGIELRLGYAEDTLRNIYKIWQRPVYIETVLDDKPVLMGFDGKEETFEELEKTSSPKQDSYDNMMD